MARETRYINRIRIGQVARYKNRILFGLNGTVFHVYIIALGRPYITGRWDCSMCPQTFNHTKVFVKVVVNVIDFPQSKTPW